ncbi:MAG: phytanoyl-CoA dioxygenase family protein [Thalassobaculaceae bacterium]|nr:phytanoyl-CoA dioxygenase family protein [Thalassobaculaceae bacterium]
MYFHAAPDGRRWPLIERNVLDEAAMDVLLDRFQKAFEVGVEKEDGSNSVSFGHIARQNRSDITDSLIATVLGSPAGDRLRELLGDHLAFLVDNCSLRFHEPSNEKSVIRYHLDADFIGIRNLMVNLWVPLCAVGRDRPGLTFMKPDVAINTIIATWRGVLAKQPNPNAPVFKFRFSDTLLEQCTGQPVDELFFTPMLESGDVALFHQFVMHATQHFPGHFETRRSLEFRVAASHAIPSFYLIWDKPLQHWSWSDDGWAPSSGL